MTKEALESLEYKNNHLAIILSSNDEWFEFIKFNFGEGYKNYYFSGI